MADFLVERGELFYLEALPLLAPRHVAEARRLDIPPALGAVVSVGRATLRRIRELQGRNQEIELVRRAIEGTSRSQFFELLPDVLPIVRDRGGDGAIAMIVDAVITIVGW